MKKEKEDLANAPTLLPQEIVTLLEQATVLLKSDYILNNLHRLGALGATDLRDAIADLDHCAQLAKGQEKL